jgi:hypothetical protein
MGILRALALCGPALALTAAPAHAGTVTAGLSLGYAAAPGEANRLAVTRAADRITFTETGGIVVHEAAAACDGDGTPSVTCAAAPAEVSVTLGDGDDTLALGGLGSLRVAADGGDGADRLDATGAIGFVGLAGGAGDDTLLAGAAESDLTGGPGADTMTGGPESAVTHYLMGAAPDGPDRVPGGAGLDVAGYSLRSAPLLLAPDGVANDGEAGEGDDLGAAVERLEGGAGEDQLIAAPGLDAELVGGGGPDRLSGGAGADLLSGGDGDDLLSGASGDDLAAPSDPVAVPDDDAQPGEGVGSAADAGADRFDGGAGIDTISYARRTAPVAASLDGVANDGEAGERDDLGGDVEGIEGGAGADLLTGRDGPQRIEGGPGGDLIDPGRGLDDVRGGDGDDTVHARDGTAEWILCGAGRDTLNGDFDDLAVSCERTTLAAAPPGADRRKPRVKLDGLPRRPRYEQVRRGLRPRVSADEPVAYVIELLGIARSAHISANPYNLVLVRKTLRRTARPRRVTLRPRIALLGPRRKLRVQIRVTAKDAADNVRTLHRTIKARR